MESQSLPPLPSSTVPTTPPAAPPTTTTSIPISYTESLDSSPRSRPPTETLDDPLPPKLRLMCSYGGHIIPRPHDKSLCYVGGDTRIVVVDRHSSLADLCSRLSRTLLNGRPFSLKYQLPHEDLDNLISVTNDEDLDNMIEEYDRINAANPAKPARLRLFLFFNKPETAMSMGALLDDSKSESWFVDALNNAGLLPRGVSDSATIDNLLNLDGVVNSDSCNNLEVKEKEEENNNKQVEKNVSDVHSMPNSPMVENASSSFGSTSSSPSMANLPPIRTRVEDNGTNQKVNIEEQFAQITVSKQDDGFAVGTANPTTSAVAMASGVAVNTVNAIGEQINRVVSDDERSDQGVGVGFRKPPLPLQQPVQQRAGGAAYNLPSPDSVASDGSIASASSLSRQMFYQDQVPVATREGRTPASPTQKSDGPVPSFQVQMQQVQVSRYMLPPQGDLVLPPQQQQQQQQQQFVHAGAHYVAHPAPGQVPAPSYYQIYTPQPSQQQLHHPVDQQYPVYVMPIMQPQPYNMSMQSNITDATATTVASNRQLGSSNPAVVATSAAYKDSVLPVYPTKTPSPTIPEIPAGAYKNAVPSTPQLVQVPSNQFPQQYVGYQQMHHPLQSVSVASSAGSNYGYEYASSAHDQAYYGQHPTGGYPPQYQTMSAAAAVALSDVSKQLPSEQQIRTSQP